MSTVKQEVRALLILRALEPGAIYPAPLEVVHAVGYMADALARVWGIAPLQDTVLKTGFAPRSAALQHSIDRLVGRGLVAASNISFREREGRTLLQADYALHEPLCARVFAVIDADPLWSFEYSAVREIALSVGSIGKERVSEAVLVDASYSDPLLDENTVLDLEPDEGTRPTLTQKANDDLLAIAMMRLGHGLSPAELTHLYVRHLYSLMESPA